MSTPKLPSGPVGYAWLRDTLQAPSFLGSREARVAGVSALEKTAEGGLLVPARMAPGPSLLEHLLFALKHEGVDLFLLSLALERLPAAELEAAFARTPNGTYVRMACDLWERLSGQRLSQGGATITAPYQPLFDPAGYLTGESRRNPRWRIDFNGIGDVDFCPVIRRTSQLQALLQEDVLGQAAEFARNHTGEMLDRALNWAYLSETEGSFAIEGEVPTQGKAAAFAHLLKHASDPRKLTEEGLCALQNIAITNPLDLAVSFRNDQNRLQRGRGAAGVRYVPPRPELVDGLMAGLMRLANQRPRNLPPLVHAAAVSFGFVFVHPFMDGNGRLSRFLIHHCLGQSGALPSVFVLPVSMSMKRHEKEYLDALNSFSKPARELCQVMWISGDDFTYDWLPGSDHAFRFMDLTECTVFTLRMAKAALEEDLQRETQWLADFDQVFDMIKRDHDIRDQDLSSLILFAFDNQGVLSRNRRKQYGERVPQDTLDAIEQQALERLRLRANGR